MKWRVWLLIGSVVLAGAGFAMHRKTGDVRIPVTLQVDFGPAGRAAHDGELLVDRGSTPKDVVSMVFPIQSGSICCNTREISAIDGVAADPAANRWWTCQVNGTRKRVSPFRTALRRGDRVAWIYVEQSQ